MEGKMIHVSMQSTDQSVSEQIRDQQLGEHELACVHGGAPVKLTKTSDDGPTEEITFEYGALVIRYS
jgi:hypothetical protein